MNFNKRVNGSWTDTPHYIHNTATDTITTLPTVLYPTGTTATVGLKGQAVQSSTPSPTSPVMPQGTGDLTGNLCTGYTTPNSQFNIYIENFKTIVDTVQNFTLSFDSEITYAGNTLYLITDGGNIVIGYVAGKGHVVKSFSFNSTQVEAIKSSTNPYIRLYVNGADMSGNTNVMLNTGSTARPYEPHGIKIPISSANTTTPVYLGEVQTTRKIRKLVLTGEENTWSQHATLTSWFMLNINTLETNTIVSNVEICSHYKPSTGTPASIANREILVNYQDGNKRIIIRDTSYSLLDDFKTFLQQQYAAGTPVTIWYVLATETTGIVNEPLMKIGTYADEVSGITIPVTAGGDALSVGTTVQPSEVTVNYKGWHPVAYVHEL